jgi:hypothetical protein
VTERPTSLITTDQLAGLITPGRPVHIDVGGAWIWTTEDKIRLCLISHRDRLEARRAWVAPAGILAALLATLFTTEFRDALLLKAEVWQAAFLIAIIASLVWLIASVNRARKGTTVDDLVAELKRATPVMLDPTGASNRELPTAKLE